MESAYQANHPKPIGTHELGMTHKVLPAHDPFVKKVLRDFRVTEDGQAYVVKVFLQYQKCEDWQRTLPSLAWRWIQALRTPYLWFTLLPIFAAAALHRQLDWGQFSLFIAATLCMQIGCHLWSDYEDHLRGVDSPEYSGGSGVIAKLWIPAVQIQRVAWCFIVLGIIVGMILLRQLPWEFVGKELLIIGVLGVVGAAGYSGWPFHFKYIALGEILIFFLSGPLLMIGAALVISPVLVDYYVMFAYAVPVGLLAILRLHAGNIQRIPYDRLAGVHTVANFGSFQRAKLVHLVPLFFLYWIVIFVLPIPLLGQLILLATLPMAIWQVWILRKLQGPLDPGQVCCVKAAHAFTSCLVFFIFLSVFR
jgi:1,4-dihydroxy-2-naphthoate polyprenyltransferase